MNRVRDVASVRESRETHGHTWSCRFRRMRYFAGPLNLSRQWSRRSSTQFVRGEEGLLVHRYCGRSYRLRNASIAASTVEKTGKVPSVSKAVRTRWTLAGTAASAMRRPLSVSVWCTSSDA